MMPLVLSVLWVTPSYCSICVDGCVLYSFNSLRSPMLGLLEHALRLATAVRNLSFLVGLRYAWSFFLSCLFIPQHLHSPSWMQRELLLFYHRLLAI